jgi:hypothetical protein
MNFTTRVATLLWADLRSTEFVAALCGFFAGASLLRLYFSHPNNISVYVIALAKVLPLYIWAILFFIYAIFRLATALGFNIKQLQLFIPVVGMSLWVSVFAAGTIVYSTPSGMAALYCIPAAFEIWALAQAIDRMKHCA